MEKQEDLSIEFKNCRNEIIEELEKGENLSFNFLDNQRIEVRGEFNFYQIDSFKKKIIVEYYDEHLSNIIQSQIPFGFGPIISLDFVRIPCSKIDLRFIDNFLEYIFCSTIYSDKPLKIILNSKVFVNKIILKEDFLKCFQTIKKTKDFCRNYYVYDSFLKFKEFDEKSINILKCFQKLNLDIKIAVRYKNSQEEDINRSINIFINEKPRTWNEISQYASFLKTMQIFNNFSLEDSRFENFNDFYENNIEKLEFEIFEKKYFF